MALLPNLIYQELIDARAAGGFPFNGFPFDQMALGIALGVSGWAVGQSQNVSLQGIVTGTIGSGAVVPVTTRLTVPPTVPLMMSALTGAGFSGQLMPSLATVVTLGISNVFNKYGQYSGPVAGVGVGQDVSKIVVANPATLQPLLANTLRGAMLGLGPSGMNLSIGLANGISLLLLQGVGTGTVAGVPGVVPASGTSISVIV